MGPGALDRKRNFPQVGSNGTATVIKAKGIGAMMISCTRKERGKVA